MKINCIIVEDEPLALERTMAYVQRLPYLHLMATFHNAMDAAIYLKSNKIDLLFLDIHLGEMSGVQMLESFGVPCEVVFTTAYHEYAIKGFELQVTDYLLKPFTFERFVQAVDRAQDNISKKAPPSDKKFIFVKTEHRLEKVMLDDILYIEGMSDYRCIHTAGKRIMTLQTFTELEKEIPQALICRVHKSYMVAIGKIETIERDRIKINQTYIPISETFKQNFWALINA